MKDHVLRNINILNYKNQNKIEFRKDGIYVKNDFNLWQRGYVFIKNASIGFFWDVEKKRKQIPRFHLYKCNGGGTFNGDFYQRFEFSNYKSVTILDWSNHRLKFFNSTLNLCKYCKERYEQETGKLLNINNTVDFFNSLNIKDDHYSEASAIDKLGFTYNWFNISETFKISNTTCKRCNLNLNDNLELLRVAHLNKNKEDNNYANLESLCLFCYLLEGNSDYYVDYEDLFLDENFLKKNYDYNNQNMEYEWGHLSKLLLNESYMNTNVYAQHLSNFYKIKASHSINEVRFKIRDIFSEIINRNKN